MGHFNSDKTRTTPATLDRRFGNNHVGDLTDVSTRAEELERFGMRDAGLVVADRGRGQARDASLLLGYVRTAYLRVAARTEPSRGTRSASGCRDLGDDRLCGIA